MKKTLPIAALLLAFNFAIAQTADRKVKQCFDNYKTSILDGKGAEAIKHVNKKTLDYYDQMLALVLTGDSATISRLGLLDKFTVLVARHRMPKAELLKMNGKNFFIYAVDKGMIGKNTVETLQIDEPKTEGNLAKAQVITNGQKSPIYFQFSNESDEWKIDITSIFPPANLALTQMISASGMTESQFIFQTLEALTGKKVTRDIWKALK